MPRSFFRPTLRLLLPRLGIPETSLGVPGATLSAPGARRALGGAEAKARAPESSGGPPYMGESNFDTNMVIILAALLCALICALGLNSVLRCALRLRYSRRFPPTFGEEDDVVLRIANNTGLKRRVLRTLPVEVVSRSKAEGDEDDGKRVNDCPICLAEFAEGDKVRILPNCNHRFHVYCIDTWLLSHSSCPTCRQNLLHLQGQSNNPPNPSVLHPAPRPLPLQP